MSISNNQGITRTATSATMRAQVNLHLYLAGAQVKFECSLSHVQDAKSKQSPLILDVDITAAASRGDVKKQVLDWLGKIENGWKFQDQIGPYLQEMWEEAKK